MGISNNYNDTVDVKRMTAVEGSSIKKEYTEWITSLACHIQPLDQSITADIEGGFGKDRLMLCSIQDIVEGDRVIHGSNEYRIVGVESFNDLPGRANHMEILIRIFKA